MTQGIQNDYTILRRKQVQAAVGYSRSTLYARMADGLWPKPVHLGPRTVGWPAREVAALNEARIGVDAIAKDYSQRNPGRVRG